MARNFAGGTDKILATINDISSLTTTFLAWVYPTVSSGIILRTEITGGTAMQLAMATSYAVKLDVNYDTTNSDATSSTTMTANAWNCVAGIHNVSTKTCKLYLGSRSTPMAEVAYASQNTGVTSAASGVNGAAIGNRTNGAAPFTGAITYPAMYTSALTLDQIEMYRLGRVNVSTGSAPAYFWPLTDPSASNLFELVAGKTGTATATTYIEDPIPLVLPQKFFKVPPIRPAPFKPGNPR